MASTPTSVTLPLLADCDDDKGLPTCILVEEPHRYPSTYRYFVNDPEQGDLIISTSVDNQAKLSNCITSTDNQAHEYYAFKYFVHARDERHFGSRERYPYCLSLIMLYLDNIEADLQWAKDSLEKRIQGRALVPWKDFERHRIANRKFPLFLCMYTIFTLIVLSVQLVLAGWENRDDLSFAKADLVTSRLTEHGEWYRLFTSVLLFPDLPDAAVNIFLLWVYGFPLERLHGSRMVATIFAVSLLGSALARATFTSYGGTNGMYGGIFGLIGCSFASMWINWDIFPSDPTLYIYHRCLCCFKYDPENRFFHSLLLFGVVCVEVPVSTVFWIIFNPFVSQAGLFYGFSFSLLFINPIGKEKKSSRAVIRHALIFAFASFCYLGTFLFLLRSGGGSESDLCPRCKILTCIEFYNKRLRGESCDDYWKWITKKATSYA